MAQRKRRGREKEEVEELEEVAEEEETEESGRGGRKKRAAGEKKPRTKKNLGRDSSVIYKDGEMPRLHGKGISLRLAMYISGALAVILVFFGIVVYNLQSHSLDEQIDSGGVEAVRVMAQTDIKCWDTLHGTAAQGREDDLRAGTLRMDMSDEDKAALLALTPGNYIGNAREQAERLERYL